MKNALITIVIVVVAMAAYHYLTDSGGDPVTRDEFNAAHNELRQQIDSVMHECDTLKSELRAVRANTDTLKAGQEVIFKTMQENKGKETSLWDLIWR